MRDHVPPRIEPRDGETFARDGAVCVRGLFNSSRVERMRRAIDRIKSVRGPHLSAHGVRPPALNER